MKGLLFLLSLALCACASDNTSLLAGRWTEATGVDTLSGRSMELRDNGELVPCDIRMLMYDRWHTADGMLILTGGCGNVGHDGVVCDTFRIVNMNGDTLRLSRGGRDVCFVRGAAISGVCRSKGKMADGHPTDGDAGWKGVTGAGLKVSARQSNNFRVLADPSLPGMVLVKDGEARPVRLVEVVDTYNRGIDGVLDNLRARKGWTKNLTCRFREIGSCRQGVRRYVLVPDGEYADSVCSRAVNGRVGATCGGWGIGDSGIRYFEIYDANPSKAVFVDMAAAGCALDENSIAFVNNAGQGLSKDILYTMEGELRIGHEVMSFAPSGSKNEYWFVDKTGKLEDEYDRMTGGKKNGRPVKAVLKVEYRGKSDEGFAELYDGVMFVREVVSLGAGKR